MKHFLFLIFSLFITRIGFSQFSLEVEITGLKNNKGLIMLQLFNENQKVISQQKGEIADNTCIIKFSDLKPGNYAVRYFHDENLSQKLETNALGKPKEGYGFSNNAAGVLGPPSFNKWIFALKGNMKIRLKPVY
jgi:uncharacterized protein (DUF2141 family)